MFRLTPFLSTLALAVPVFAAAATDHRPATKPKINPAPSADLRYSVKAKQGGMVINGETLAQWRASPDTYSIATEIRAMLVGKIREEKSEGAIDGYGLAPLSYTEKRFRKSATTASFNRQTKTIGFTESEKTYPIKGGEQDRASAMWQLIAMARAAPEKFKQGSSWTFFVAGQHDADPWTFKVGKREKIKTSEGEVNTVRVAKAPAPGSSGQQLDIWLAPGMEWYPVRLRIAEPDGDYVEQNLETIAKK